MGLLDDVVVVEGHNERKEQSAMNKRLDWRTGSSRLCKSGNELGSDSSFPAVAHVDEECNRCERVALPTLASPSNGAFRN